MRGSILVFSLSLVVCAASQNAPSSWSSSGPSGGAGKQVFTLSGGASLQLGSGEDAFKVVIAAGSCSDAAAGGTGEVTDLGPDDSTGAASAHATVYFDTAGVYKLCYKLNGGSYAQVGSTLTVVPALIQTDLTIHNAIVGMETPVSFSFTLNEALAIGDALVLQLPGMDSESHLSAPSTVGCGNTTFQAGASDGSGSIALTLMAGVAQLANGLQCTVHIARGLYTGKLEQTANLDTRTAAVTFAGATDIGATPIATSSGLGTYSSIHTIQHSDYGVITACDPHPITVASAGAIRVCYTTDGTLPACSATKQCSAGVDYASSPIPRVYLTTTIKAIGCGSAGDSSVQAATYTFPLHYLSSTIANAAPNSLVVTLDSAITAGTATIADFTVTVDGVPVTPSNLVQTGTGVSPGTLTFALPAPVAPGAAVSIAYVKSATTSQNLASAYGAPMESLVAEHVKNRVGYGTLLQSSLLVDTPQTNQASAIAYTFELDADLAINDTLSLVLPGFGLGSPLTATASGCGSTTFSVNSGASNRTLIFTAADAELSAQSVCSITISSGVSCPPIVQGSNEPSRTVAVMWAAFYDIPTTSIAASTAVLEGAPILVSTVVANSAPSSLVLSFDFGLTTGTLHNSDFELKVAGSTVPVTGVIPSDLSSNPSSTVQLSFSNAITAGQAVSVEYIKGSGVAGGAGGDLESFTAVEALNLVGVGSLSSSVLGLGFPVIGQPSTLSYAFQLDVALDVGDNITLHLPGFGLVRGISYSDVATLSGCGTSGYTVDMFDSFTPEARVVFTASAGLNAGQACTLGWDVGTICPRAPEAADLSTRTVSVDLGSSANIYAAPIPSSPEIIEPDTITLGDTTTTKPTSFAYFFWVHWGMITGDGLTLNIPYFQFSEESPTVATTGCGSLVFSIQALGDDTAHARFIFVAQSGSMDPFTLCTLTLAEGVRTPRLAQQENWVLRTVTMETVGGAVTTRPIKFSPGITTGTQAEFIEFLPAPGIIPAGQLVVAIPRSAALPMGSPAIGSRPRTTARICYTTDGSTPQCTSSLTCAVGVDQAVTPIPLLTADTTIKAAACANFVALNVLPIHDPSPPVVTGLFTLANTVASTPVYTPAAEDVDTIVRRCKTIIEAPMGSVVQLFIPSIRTKPGDCLKESISLLDGFRDDAPPLARYCGTDAPPMAVSTSRALQVVFQAPSASTSTFSAVYSLMKLDVRFTAVGPVPLGGDIVLPWEVSYVTGTLPTTPSEASQWVGLYAAGSCPVDHGCHLGAVHVPIQDIAGLARFRISDYGQAGQFELRFFRGNHQGHLCTGLQNVKLHRCHLQPAAISEVVSVTANREATRGTEGLPGFEMANPSYYLN